MRDPKALQFHIGDLKELKAIAIKQPDCAAKTEVTLILSKAINGLEKQLKKVTG